MKRNKKGISLITLVITIIIMIILAAAIVLTLTNSGIFDKANDATSKYNLQQVQKIAELAWAEAYADGERDVTKLQEAVDEALRDNELDDKYEAIADEKGVTVKAKGQGGNGGNSGTTLTVATAKNNVLSTTSNTEVYDEYGNKIVVPAGFMIRVDEGTERTKGSATSFATHVTEGIVIEDANENQFVWVPVGKIYTDVDKTESLAKTITLGRYSNFTATDGVYTPAQTAEDYATPTTINSYYTEDTAENHNSEYGNAIARNIGDFVNSSIQNGGYYIGRFEAGKENDTLVCQSGKTVYNDITQPNASTASKNMYNDGYATGTFSSDLINSYAWDTAIIFIQTFGEDAASSYYDDRNCTLYKTTGGNQDEFCNINDMSGNGCEWSTETYDGSSVPSVYRGGYVSSLDSHDCGGATSNRNFSNGPSRSTASFRPILYVAVAE